MTGAVEAALDTLGDVDCAGMVEVVTRAVAPDAVVHMCHPWGDLIGAGGWVDGALGPLWRAMPDVARRVDISITGRDGHDQTWLGQAGHYVGRLSGEFLGLPTSARPVFLRYHEFYRLDGDRAAEAQIIWDLPDLMLQLGVWPMGPALGRTGLVPASATQDGRRQTGDGARAKRVVGDMLDRLNLSPQGEAAMNLPAAWHPRCDWYGPGGIGHARGIWGFRDHHQIPFLDALPDRRGHVARGHFFGQGDYAAFTAWPGMTATITGDGWLGMAPTGQQITLRSLDFWRIEGDLIRENWVCVDLLDIWAQLGVDVLARMRQLH